MTDLGEVTEKITTGIDIIKQNLQKISDVKIQMDGLRTQGFNVQESIEGLCTQENDYEEFMKKVMEDMKNLAVEVENKSGEIKNF